MKIEETKRHLAYVVVFNKIKEEIESGQYTVGSLLPPEPELEKLHFVSRTTIRKAVELLAKEGYVKVKQGYGTEILEHKTSQNLNSITSVSQTLRNKGYKVGVKNIHMSVINIESSTVCEALGIQKGTKVVEISRIQTADGAPVSIVKNYIPYDLVSGIENTGEKIASLYEFLDKNFGISINASHDKIGACNANFEESILLETSPGVALITIDRTCYSNGRAVEFDYVKILASKYEFEVKINM